MDYYSDAFLRALQLIITLDQEVIEVVMTSLKISISSAFFASLISIPLAVVIARKKFKSKKFVKHYWNNYVIQSEEEGI